MMKGFWVILFVAAGFGGGVWVGYNKAPAIDRVRGVNNISDANITSRVDFDPFWKTWNLLQEKYVPSNISSTTKTTESLVNQRLVWGAIEGLVAAVGDPYTIFLPPRENEIFKSDIAGNFEGVGMEIGLRDDVLTVVAPLKGSPAERAGVRAGDLITAIDNVSTQGIRVDEAVSQIRGTKGTSVTLTILRKDNSEPIEIKVLRDVINLPTIETEVITTASGKVFVIRLYNFSATSPNLFRNALQEFVASGSNKLILDLRGNPGGYLEAAVDMASWFLPEGKTVVREYFGESEPEKIHRSRDYNVFNDSLRMVILVNGGSASASEILAGALSEHGIAKLVGEQTFGKGSVQELVDVTDDTALKVTVARWLTPLGHSISEKGITPDYVVKMTKEDLESERDPQLDKAISIISN